MMAYKIRSIVIVIAIAMFILSFSACTFEAKGIPVKKYTSSIEPSDLESQLLKKKTQEEIVRMSQITENSVFTERRGIPEYIIGPGDILTINFWEGPKINTYDAVVRPDGKISYSFIDNVTVSGRTAHEVNEVLTEALKRYIREPRLEIIVKEYKSKNTLLFGQINILQTGVSGPGKYPLKGKTTILDLIVMAGGPITGHGLAPMVGRAGGTGGQESGNADLRNVEVVRKGKRYTVNLYDAMFKGDMSQNIVVDDGDIITVPELPIFGERVYVFGEVFFQGIFRLKDAYDLLAAISISGGTTHIAVKSDIKIIREYKERRGRPIIISANLDKILKRGEINQNMQLKDGDIVYVPRTVIGDINEFIINTVPIMDYLLYPGEYRDAYFDDKHLRFRKLN